MKHTDKLLTGGDGFSGQTGLEVRTNINDQFAVVMGNTEYLPETFVFTTLNLSPFANKVIEIAFQHDLAGASFTLPNNCTLYFNGGALLNAGTITGNYTKIFNPLNKQIFNVDVIIAGTWLEVKACVQWFGGISNPDRITYINDVMIPLGKLLSTRWEVFWINGNYYIGSTLEVTNPVTMELGNSKRFNKSFVQSPTGSWMYTSETIPTEVVRFYSNLDIDWFWIKSPHVRFRGGIFDNSGAPKWNHSMIYMNANNSIDHCEFSQFVFGNSTAILAPNQTGHYIFWEATGAIYGGHLFQIKIDADIYYQPIGIEIQKKDPTGNASVWANNINIHAWIEGCKVCLIHRSAGHARIDITTQTKAVLDITEKDWYSVIIDGNPTNLEGYCWDMQPLPNPETGAYYPNNGMYLESDGVVLGALATSAYRTGQIRGIPPKSFLSLNNSNNPIFLRSNSSSNLFISELHNFFNSWVKKSGNTLSITGRIGTDFNFDSQLEAGSAPESPNISFANPENLLTSEGGIYKYNTSFSFDSGSDIDNDFVEIVLSTTNSTEIRLLKLFVYLEGQNKRIQVIGKKVNSTYDSYTLFNVYDKLVKQSYEFNINNNSYTSLIIRIIGTSTIGSSTGIMDIAGKTVGYEYNYLPKTNDFRYKWSGLLTQIGTSAPTISEHLSTTRYPVTSRYISVGQYGLGTLYDLEIEKTDPLDETAHVYQGITFIGTVRISRSNDNEFLIRTWNSSGVLANGILNNQHVSFNVGW